jgi:hypothetical protein
MNRNLTQFQYSFEKKWVSVFATVVTNGTTVSTTLRQWQAGTFGGAAGYANAVSAGFKGIGGGTNYPATTVPIIYAGSAGLYTVYFQDRYIRLIGFSVTYLTSAVPSCPTYSVPLAGINLTPAVVTTTPSINVQFFNSSGTATSPTAGETHLWQFDLADSSAP